MEVLKMNAKERERKAVFEMVRQKRLSIKQASEHCEISYRQALRIYKSYIAEGDAGLIHKHRSEQSNRKNPHREAIIARYKARYEGFGPTLASEYLSEEDGYTVSPETLRRWLLAEGLWKKIRKRNPHRQRREPKAQFGELVQIDGSIHDWLGLGTHSCLLNMVDDATSKTLSRLDTGETTRVVFETLWRWIKSYGVPLSVYVDLKTVYVSPSSDGFSHFEKACEKLGIRIIKARSPQAKGRVERNHRVYQDRFVKELELRGISTVYEANKLLESTFLDKLNKKFEKPARNDVSAHKSMEKLDLNQILCWEYERKLRNDYTFSFSKKHYQVKKSMGLHLKPNSKILIRRHLNNELSAWFGCKRLEIHELESRPIENKQKLPRQKPPQENQRLSPWRESNEFLFQKNITSEEEKALLRNRGF